MSNKREHMTKKKLTAAAARWAVLLSSERCAALFSWLLLVFPLYVQGGYAHISAAKYGLFCLLCALTAVLLAAGWFLRTLLRRQELDLAIPRQAPSGRPLPSEYLLLGFALLSVLSVLCSDYGWQCLSGLGGRDGLILQLLLIAATLLLSRCAAWRDGFAFAAVPVTLLLTVLAFLQLAGLNPLGLYPPGYTYYDGGVRYVGQFLSTIGNIDMLAAVYTLLLPLSALAVIRSRKLWWRVSGVLAVLSGLCLLLLMRTEGALLGVLAALLLLLCYHLPPRRRKWLLLLCVLLLALLLLWLYNYTGAEQGTLWELSRILHGDIRDEFGSARVQIWRAALDAVEQHPWFGSGCGTEKAAFDIEYSRLSAESGRLLTARVTRAHNEYLAYAIEVGIPAALLYLLALLLSLLQAVRKALRCNDVVLVYLCAGLMAYAVQALFNYRAIVAAPLFWLLWGWCLNRIRERETAS